MDEHSLLMEFIAQKREFEKNGWKVHWIFEASFMKNLAEMYGKKMLFLEERLENPGLNANKLGNFLMCGLVKKKFDERISGKNQLSNVKGIKIIQNDFRSENNSSWIAGRFQ